MVAALALWGREDQKESQMNNPKGGCGRTAAMTRSRQLIRGIAATGMALVLSACGGGDSGAAMFFQNTGYGIVKSARSDTPLPGECKSLTGMPFSRVRAWGFQPN